MRRRLPSYYEIVSDVPIPASRDVRYNFGKMKIGDSFALSNDPEETQRVRSAASWYGKRHGVRFSVRLDAHGNYRCWRVAPKGERL